MIVLRNEDLHDQAGMERAFRWYFEHVEDDPACRGTFNTMLDTRFFACDYETRTLTLTMEPQHWMNNPGMILHGGVSASVLDMTMGLLCRYCSGGYMTPTIDLNVAFLRPGPLDRTLYIRAEVTKPGLTVCHAAGVMWSEGAPDRAIATASGSYFVTGKKE